MALFISGLTAVLFVSCSVWYLMTQASTGTSTNVQALWRSLSVGEKWALLVQCGAVTAAALLLALRSAPGDLILPVFWVIFPALVIVFLVAGAIGVWRMRHERRPASVIIVVASAMAIVAVLTWMFLPRVIVLFEQILSGRPL